MDLKVQVLLFITPLLVGLGIILTFQSINLSKSNLIFCDVGQGDGILITSGSKQAVVDGGPGEKILECLSSNMPFWDRDLELVIMTHPQRDHMEGLLAVLERYRVKTIVVTGVGNNTGLYKAWEEAVGKEKAQMHIAQAGERFAISRGLSLDVLWPSFAKVTQWQAEPPSDLNETSIVMRLEWGRPSTSSGSARCAYLTGDLPKELLEPLIDRSCEILKVSHHGSKTGTSKAVLDLAQPKVAIIQVGKNSFGHPHKEVVDLLISKGIKILRNDTDGTIRIGK